MNGGVLIMKKYLKEILILLIQLFMFYVFPLFAGPTDVMGMIVLLILAKLVDCLEKCLIYGHIRRFAN